MASLIKKETVKKISISRNYYKTFYENVIGIVDNWLSLHKERYEYSHEREEIIANFTNFENADNDFEPLCLKGKFWEIIKLDFVEAIDNLIA